MTQSTKLVIPNETGLQFRQDVNMLVSALNTDFAGSIEPTVTEAYMKWRDTSTTPNVIKIRSADNLSWGDFEYASLADLGSDAAGKGASLIAYKPELTGAVGTTVFDVIGDGAVSIFRFMSSTQIANVKAGSSTDDTAAFVAALTSGARNIEVPPYNFIVGTAYLSGLSNIYLHGTPGKSSITKKAGSYGVNVDGAIAGIFDFVSCTNVTLYGISFNGNKINATPSGGGHLNVVNFYLCNGVHVTKCGFDNYEFQGLNAQCTNRAYVHDNEFEDGGFSGVGFSGGYFSTFGANSCVISGNRFKSIWAGIQCQVSTRYVTISNNIFVNSSLIFAQDVQFATISNNTFDGPAPSDTLGDLPQDAITIEADSNVVIHGNTINAPARHGIYVVGNYMPNGPLEGVMVCNNIIISKNTINNTIGNGIQFDPGSAFTYDMGTHTASPAAEANYTYGANGSIVGNIINNSGGYGISFGITRNCVIANNVVIGSAAAGVAVNSCKGVYLNGNTIMNSSYGAADVYDGIFVSASAATLQRIVISNNILGDDQISRTQRYGVNAQNSAADVKMMNNIFAGNGTDFITNTITLPLSINNSPTLLNGATPFGGGFETPGYYVDNDGIVHLRGLVLLGSAGVGAAVFILPEGMRPRYDEMFVVIANSAIGRCDIKASNGEVVATSGANSQYFNLSGISFAAKR